MITNNTFQNQQQQQEQTQQKETQQTNEIKKKTSVFTEIAERMKNYEKNQSSHLNENLPFMARLDGHTFSKFAAPFRKPFDELLHYIMICTTTDLLKQFPYATTGYTQSDEITLIFPKLYYFEELLQKEEEEQKLVVDKVVDNNVMEDNTESNVMDNIEDNVMENLYTKKKKSLPFAGRVLKFSTLLSSYCSIRFNFHCQRMSKEIPNLENYLNNLPKNQTLKNYNPQKVFKKLTCQQAHFDCRIFNVNTNLEILNNIRWRSNFDCQRNSITNLGRSFYSQKEMNGLKPNQVIKKLKEEKNINWENYPKSYRFGSFIKKYLIEKEGLDVKSGKSVVFKRNRYDAYAFSLNSFDEKYVRFLLAKNWNEVFENGWLNDVELDEKVENVCGEDDLLLSMADKEDNNNRENTL
ncbi:hypothetical protein ABK040_007935 [Willaertia magna]